MPEKIDLKKDVNVDIRDIPTKDIRDNPYQARQKYNTAAIKRLAKSISMRGLMHPVVVAKTKDGFVLISGHRRLRAMRSMRRKTIPAVVKKDVKAKDLALDMYIENALRDDLRPIEKSKAILQALSTIKEIKRDVFMALSLIGATKQWKDRGVPKKRIGNMKNLGKRVGECSRILALLAMSENTAICYLRLLMLPKSIIPFIESARDDTNKFGARRKEGYITVKQAYELSRIADPALQKELYRKTIENGWTYWVLRSTVDELLENGTTALEVSRRGRAGRKVENYGMEAVAKECFKLGGRLWTFRSQQLVMMRISLEKTVLRAGLKNVRRSCEYLLDEIDKTLDGPAAASKKKKAAIEEMRFDVVVKDQHGGLRFTLPNKVAKGIGVKIGDTIRISARKVEG